jgi:hypothetical protein
MASYVLWAVEALDKPTIEPENGLCLSKFGATASRTDTFPRGRLRDATGQHVKCTGGWLYERC